MPNRSDAATAEVEGRLPATGELDSGRLSTRTHLGVVAGAFFALRVLLWGTGLRFRDHLVGQVQLLDEGLLRADPLRAFTSLHIQPPLWNFYVGAVRRWSPLPDALTFQGAWVAADLLTVMLLWSLLVQLGARRWQATVASILVASSPFLIQNESLLTYETLVTLVVTASVQTFARYLRSPTFWRLVVFAGVLLTGVLTRTLLQPLWMLSGFAVLLLIARRRRAADRRSYILLGALSLLVIADLLFLHARFGSLGYSSYVGSNVERIAITTLPQTELDRLVKEGTVSELARVKPYSPYAAYRSELPHCSPEFDDPALARSEKADGETNLNYICFLPVYRQALRDSRAAIRADPGQFARTVLQSAAIFSSWSLTVRAPDTRSFRLLEDIYKPLLLPTHIRYDFGGDDPQPLARIFRPALRKTPFLVTLLAGIALSLLRAIRSAWRLARRRGTDVDWVQCWIGYTVASVAAVGILFDFYENGRFREALDPILLGPLIVAVLSAATSVLRGLQPGTSDALVQQRDDRGET